jgi:hypothetical protein
MAGYEKYFKFFYGKRRINCNTLKYSWPAYMFARRPRIIVY